MWIERVRDEWKVAINDMKSKWQPVINGAPQRSVQSYSTYDLVRLPRQLCHILLEALQG